MIHKREESKAVTMEMPAHPLLRVQYTLLLRVPIPTGFSGVSRRARSLALAAGGESAFSARGGYSHP